MSLKHDFERQGFAVVKGVLSAERVAQMRAQLDEYFAGTEPGAEMPASDFLQKPELWEIVVSDSVVSTIRELLGDRYTLYPNMTVRKSLYVGWHVDTAFAGPGKPHVWDEGFAHVQGAIYLQDNDEATGGGLDLVSGSHQPPLPRLRGDHPLSRAVAPLVERARDKVTLRANAGDLVLWHARTLHRSTPAQRDTGPTKYGMFFSCSRDDPYVAHRYLTHLVGQAVQRKNGATKFVPRYREVLELRYPDRFPPEFRRAIDEHSISVATF